MHKLSMNLPDPIFEYLQKVAKEDDISMTYIVIEALKAHQKERGKSNEYRRD